MQQDTRLKNIISGEEIKMSKYAIHCCNSRLWYVQEFLIPSMLKQGISKNDILLYVDKHNLGNLESCMRIFQSMNGIGGTWHLQDDVIICKDFKKRTKQLEKQFANQIDKPYTIICGFASVFDKRIIGQTNIENMWWSFPCIYIPNTLASLCADWFYLDRTQNEYRGYIDNKNCDDFLFRQYIHRYHKNVGVYNVAPNLVNHIDFLIGGSTVNKIRKEKILLSEYWDDDKAITKLANDLQKRT